MFVLETGNEFRSTYRLFKDLRDLSAWFVKNKDIASGDKFVAVHQHTTKEPGAGGLELFTSSLWFANLVKLDTGTLLLSRSMAPHELLEMYRIADLKGITINGRD